MNDLYIEDMLEGINDALNKHANEHLFTSPSGASLFPTSNSQAKWKYSRSNSFLRLHDGQKVYSFHLPGGMSHEEEFSAVREPDMEPSKFEEGATEKGLAQVHRSDPGSIYLTLQEGKHNPTITLKHTGETNWRGTPKKRKVKEPVIPGVNIPAVAETFHQEPEKVADFSPVKWLAGPGTAALKRTVMAPGELVSRLGNAESAFPGMAGAAAVGAGLGGLYHVGKRNLYNTPEENAMEDEEGHKALLRRILFPAAGLSLLGGAQASTFRPHYQDLVAGNDVSIPNVY